MKFNDIFNRVFGNLIVAMLIGFVIWFGVITETYMMLIGFLMIVCLGGYVCHLNNKCNAEYYETQNEDLV